MRPLPCSSPQLVGSPLGTVAVGTEKLPDFSKLYKYSQVENYRV